MTAERCKCDERALASETRAMLAMTGFSNVAIYEYRELHMSVLRPIAADRRTFLVDFRRSA